MRFTACHCCSSLSLVVIRKKVRKKERKKMRIFYCLEFGSFCWSSCSMWAVQEFCLSYDELFWHNLHHKAHRQYFFADIHIFVVLCTLLPLPSNEFVSFRTEFWPLFITFVCTFQVWKESKCSDDTAYMWTQCFARCDVPTISWNGLIHAATHLYSQSITFDTNDNYWNRSNILRTLLQMIFGVNIFNEHERNDIECHQGRRKNQFPFYERSNFGWLFVGSHSLPIEIDRTNERNKCMPHVQNISPHTFTYIKLNSIPLCNSF